MSLLLADVELLDHESWTHEAIPTVKDAGAGLEKVARRLCARVATEIDLDMLETTITSQDLRHFLVNLWRTWHTDEAPSSQYQGVASLDPGAGEVYARAGKAWLENPASAKAGFRQLVAVVDDVQRLAPAGLLLEPARTNLVTNPAFKDTGGSPFTGWTTTGVTADATDTITDVTDSAQSAKMTRSGTGNNRAEQAFSLTASTAYYFSAYHKDDSAAAMTVQVIRASDGFFWTGSAWQSGAFTFTLTTRSSADRDYIGPILKDAATGNVTFRMMGESVSGQINHLYHVQVEAGRSATSPILVAGTRAKDDLKIENYSGRRVWDVARGDADIVFVPNWNGADLTGGTVLVLLDAYFDASNYMRLQYDVSTGSWQFISRVAGNSYTASKSQAMTRGTAVVLGLRWAGTDGEEGLAPYTVSLFVNGVRGTDASPPSPPTATASPYLYIGQDNAGANQADGAARYLKVRPFVLADDEHVDFP